MGVDIKFNFGIDWDCVLDDEHCELVRFCFLNVIWKSKLDLGKWFDVGHVFGRRVIEVECILSFFLGSKS